VIDIRQGDCMDVLPTLPAGHFHTVVTSPPYWGLRSYAGEQARAWGGEPECEHEWAAEIVVTGPAQKQGSTSQRKGRTNAQAQRQRGNSQGQHCQRCGAWAGALGLEPTPERYVENIVAVFREVKRVLRDDGVVFLNLGDSYAGSGKGAFGTTEARDAYRPKVKEVYVPTRAESPLAGLTPPGLKPKDLVGIPWMVAFALRADGWYLRSDIIWAKPNPMPESVRDRPTRAHEYVFLLSKKARYWYDADAIREPAKFPLRTPDANGSTITGGAHSRHTLGENLPERERRTDKQRGHGRRHDGFNDRWDAMTKEEQQAMGANKRSVWTIATQPTKEAHFATFPEALVRPCILAGSPEGGHVLDPFAGSGTVGVVAQRAGRSATLIELSPEYVAIMERRLAQRALPLGTFLLMPGGGR
jgi:DNA modification methylase